MKEDKNSTDDLKKKIESLEEKIKELQNMLSKSRATFLNIAGKSSDGIVIVNKNKMVIYANYVAMGIFDRSIADLLGEPLDIDFNHLLNSGKFGSEITIPQKSGEVIVTEATIFHTEWNNETCIVVSFHDITQRKKTEKILEYMSTHDFLTDIPNRMYFEKRLSKTINDAEELNQHMALLYLDLDNFKMINDTLGHNNGDFLLKEVSTMLRKNSRVGDTVARVGGDEFAVILHSLRKPEYAETVAKNILMQFKKPILLNGKEVYTGASIGIAVYPQCGENAIELIKNSDIAMYAAKQHGKNQFRYFSKELNHKNEREIKIIDALRKMIHDHELRLQYQPIIDLKELKCCGAEALLRWKHPELGDVPPDELISCAEDAGMMAPIDMWVVKQALSDYKSLNMAASAFISVNMSANKLNISETVEHILHNIKKNNIKMHNVVLELTETYIMKNPEEFVERLKQFSQLGVQIAIDDYGTGYSSLSYLKRLPISILKIDKSFIEDIDKDINDKTIVTSTIQLAHSLGLKVIAEGVETKAQADFLKEYQCDYAQGYYYAHPLDLDALNVYLKQ